MYSTKKWYFLYLGILGTIPIILYLVEGDYSMSFWIAVIFESFFIISSIYFFIKDARPRRKSK
jgi:hypothetical protein